MRQSIEDFGGSVGDACYRVTWKDAVHAHGHALQYGGVAGAINENGVRSALHRPYVVITDAFTKRGWRLLGNRKKTMDLRMATNKRTASQLGLLLLHKSGYTLQKDEDALADITMCNARDDVGCDDLAEWFGENLVR